MNVCRFGNVDIGSIFVDEDTKLIRLPGPNRAIALFPLLGLTKICHPATNKNIYQDCTTALTHAEAELLTWNDRGWTKVCNNTWIQKSSCGEDRVVSLKYHETEIITWYPDGRICLSVGGWHSTSTLDRLTRYSPLHCRMKKLDGEYRIIAETFGPLYHDLVIKPGSNGTWIVAE